jgi:hypothetical protein
MRQIAVRARPTTTESKIHPKCRPRDAHALPITPAPKTAALATMMAMRALADPNVGTRINSTPILAQAMTPQCQTTRSSRRAQFGSIRAVPKTLVCRGIHALSGGNAQGTGRLNQRIPHLRASMTEQRRVQG